ncbi:hypothetical protein RLDS_24610 [Sphingobium lactosutens DS20]|uniref:Uncharacterized protein n=1 Tax=Sphingobium lactosutens DS20 TaxID=1331060 RepID=T0HG24_9SPHN|nr:hypothetical protein RLDS_24610 [Sphingobium lactosutens DS20]
MPIPTTPVMIRSLEKRGRDGVILEEIAHA